MIEQLYTLEPLPGYVFRNDYRALRFFEFELIVSGVSGLWVMLARALQNSESDRVRAAIQREDGIQDLGSFSISNDFAEWRQFILSEKDEQGLEYVILLAPVILIYEEQGRVCIYADRELDLCIVGGDAGIVESLRPWRGLAFPTESVSLPSYTEFLSKWCRNPAIVKAISDNYSGRVVAD